MRTDPFAAALAARLDRATLLWRVAGWSCHRTELGVSIAGPKGEALSYAWHGVDLDAVADLKVPQDRKTPPRTSQTDPPTPTKINKSPEAVAFNAAEEPSEDGAEEAHTSAPSSPADPDPPRRPRRGLTRRSAGPDSDRGWTEVPLPGGLRQW